MNTSILQKANQEFVQSWQPGIAVRTLCQAPLVLDSVTSGNLTRQEVRYKELDHREAASPKTVRRPNTLLGWSQSPVPVFGVRRIQAIWQPERKTKENLQTLFLRKSQACTNLKSIKGEKKEILDSQHTHTHIQRQKDGPKVIHESSGEKVFLLLQGILQFSINFPVERMRK